MKLGKVLFLFLSSILFTFVEPCFAQRGADRGGGGGGVIDENGTLRFLDLHRGRNLMSFTRDRYQRILTAHAGRSEISNKLTRVAASEFFSCAIEIFEKIESENNFRFPILSLPLKHVESFHVLTTEIPLEAFYSGQIDLVYENALVRIDHQRKSPLLSESLSASLQRPIAYFHHRFVPQQSTIPLPKQKMNFGFLIVNRQLYKELKKDPVESCAFQVHEALRRVSSFAQDSGAILSNPKINFSFFKNSLSTTEVENLTQILIANHFRSTWNFPVELQRILSDFALNIARNYPRLTSDFESNISPDLYLHLFRSYLRDFSLEWYGTRVLETEWGRTQGPSWRSFFNSITSVRSYDLMMLSY